MEFTNSFTVEAPLSVVWQVITDPQEVTPCVPGAQITEMVDETHFKGTVKVKLGAVQMSYRGEMEMQPDEANHSIVLQGKGTEARGSGGATGKVTLQLQEQGTSTQVNILSQVDVTGRVAQFGRGIMQDVANRLIRDFSACLEQKLTSGGESEEASPAQAAPVSAAPPAQSQAQERVAPAPQADPQEPARPQPQTQGEVRPATASSQPMTTTSTAGSELRLVDILLDVTRSRIAAGLRELAKVIEPK